MGNLVSKRSKREITDADRAVLTLKTQKRKLEDQCRRVDGLIEREVVVAKTLVAQGKNDKALVALRRKRMHIQQYDTLQKFLINIEETLANVEGAVRQKRLFDTLRQGADALKQLQKEVALDDVEKLMSDTAEAKSYEDSIQSMLGESWTGEDEMAAGQELAALEAEMLDEEVLALPKVPTSKVPVPDVVPAETATTSQPQTATAGRMEEPLPA